MIKNIVKGVKIWSLKRQLKSIEEEIEEFYLILSSRNDEFKKNLDIDKIHQKFINLRNIEKKELNRQISELKKS